MSKYLSERLQAIVPYTPGEQPKIDGLTKLNTNESPFPPSPAVIRALNSDEVGRLNLYSDPTSSALVDAIANRLGVSETNILPGNGSDEILAFCFQAFCDEAHQPAFADITYGFYPVFCELFGLTPQIVPLRDDLTIEPADYTAHAGPIFIANPNAPTGIALELPQIEALLQLDRIVVVDEAYVDFGAATAVTLLPKYDNLIVVRTFSKSRNLAGARLGFAVANESLIEDLNRIKYSFNPYNVNRLSMIAGVKAMEDDAYFHACIGKIIETREKTVSELKRRGFEIPPSKANFIFPKHPKLDAKQFFDALRARKILVRYFSSPRICDRVRVTIGSEEQMRLFIKATDEILEESRE